MCLTVAVAPNHVIKRHLQGALRLLGLVATDTSSTNNKQAAAAAARSIVQLVPPPSTTATTTTMSSAMGNHSYDYDVIVIGGGSGGLVRTVAWRGVCVACPARTARIFFFFPTLFVCVFFARFFPQPSSQHRTLYSLSPLPHRARRSPPRPHAPFPFATQKIIPERNGSSAEEGTL